MQIDRIEFLKEMEEEKILRESIRRVISAVRQRKSAKAAERQEGERYLRTIVRKLIKEARTPDQDPSPGKSTGINVLEDLLKKIIPILQDDYKLLTTSEEQRDSFRAHIVNGILKTIKPVEVANAAGQPPEIAAAETEEIIDLSEIIDVDIGDEEKFIDIDDDEPAEEVEELSPQEEFAAGLDDKDLTGRNMAYNTYKKIESNIIDAYELLEDEEDKDTFVDYLVTNVKLYFDKFEAELAPSVIEPTTPEYEAASKESEIEAPEEELEGGAELGLGV
jgi:hypothetical protein